MAKLRVDQDIDTVKAIAFKDDLSIQRMLAILPVSYGVMVSLSLSIGLMPYIDADWPANVVCLFGGTPPFQRSGALLIALVTVLTIRHFIAAAKVNGRNAALFSELSNSGFATEFTGQLNDLPEVRSELQVRSEAISNNSSKLVERSLLFEGFLVVFGTLIWGFGDLLQEESQC